MLSLRKIITLRASGSRLLLTHFYRQKQLFGAIMLLLGFYMYSGRNTMSQQTNNYKPSVLVNAPWGNTATY